MKKLIRVSTIPLSLNLLLNGQLSFLNKYYSLLAISGEGENMEAVRSREKVATKVIEMERGINILRDLRSFWQLYLCFRKEKPLIVHSITPKAGLLSMTAAYFSGVPIRMHTFTGLIFPSKTGLLKTILIMMDKILCYFATNIYPEGNGVKNDLIQYGITNKSLKVLANGNVNGIDTSFFSRDVIPKSTEFQLRDKLKIGPGDFIFIFVGRLVGDKGINELVAAFKKLELGGIDGYSDIFKNVKLLLVGPFEAELDPLKPSTIHEIKNNSNILSVGFQADIRPYLAVSNVLAFPSYREGFPNVVMQAGAMNLASIVTNINGSNEIIREGENGVIIPVQNTDALYSAMKEMILNQDLRMSFEVNSRRIIKENYEREVVWKALLAEYKYLEDNLIN